MLLLLRFSFYVCAGRVNCSKIHLIFKQLERIQLTMNAWRRRSAELHRFLFRWAAVRENIRILNVHDFERFIFLSSLSMLLLLVNSSDTVKAADVSTVVVRAAVVGIADFSIAVVGIDVVSTTPLFVYLIIIWSFRSDLICYTRKKLAFFDIIPVSDGRISTNARQQNIANLNILIVWSWFAYLLPMSKEMEIQTIYSEYEKYQRRKRRKRMLRCRKKK